MRWDLFDWRRSYLHCDLTVARKLEEERFVPLNAKARALLESWLKAEGLWEAAQAGELEGKCCLIHDRETISGLARQRSIIDEWPQDVMRHHLLRLRDGSVGRYNRINTAQRAAPGSHNLFLEKSDPDHPLVAAYNARSVHVQLRRHLREKGRFVLHRPPGVGGRMAITTEDAAANVKERLFKHFR